MIMTVTTMITKKLLSPLLPQQLYVLQQQLYVLDVVLPQVKYVLLILVIAAVDDASNKDKILDAYQFDLIFDN